jgi:hypothetical protein
MKWTAGLTAPQIAAVTGVFWFTLIGAIVLALWFRWRNQSVNTFSSLLDHDNVPVS